MKHVLFTSWIELSLSFVPSCAPSCVVDCGWVLNWNAFLPLSGEGLFFWRTYLGCQLSAPKSHAIDAPCIEFSGSRRLNRSCLRCYCLGASLDPENIPPSSLTSYVDESLLVISVIFAYVAGAIPQKTAISGAQCNNTEQDNVVSSSIPCGR